jgi:hypothetical protein
VNPDPRDEKPQEDSCIWGEKTGCTGYNMYRGLLSRFAYSRKLTCVFAAAAVFDEGCILDVWGEPVAHQAAAELFRIRRLEQVNIESRRMSTLRLIVAGQSDKADFVSELLAKVTGDPVAVE